MFKLVLFEFFSTSLCYNISDCPVETVENCRNCGRSYLVCFRNVQKKITSKNSLFWYWRPFLVVVCLQKNSPEEFSSSLWTNKAVNFQAAVCFVKYHFLHGITSSCKFWDTVRKLEIINIWYFINVQCSFPGNKRCIK